MASISISVYGISLKNSRTDEFYNLNDIEGVKFLDYFTDFLNINTGDFKKNDAISKVFKVETHRFKTHINNSISEYDFVFSKVKSGGYGIVSEIIDSDTGSIQYNKGANDADVIPFYFTLAVPSGNMNRGILILENVGIYGVKQQFKQLFGKYLKEINREFKLNIFNLTPIKYIDHFLEEGILKTIRFFRYDIPIDDAQRIGLNNGVAFDEYAIHNIGRHNDILDKIKSYIRGAANIRNIAEVNFEYDNVKLEIKLGKKNKVINLENLNKVVISEDVTDQLIINGGHPTESSIYEVMEENIDTYLRESGLLID